MFFLALIPIIILIIGLGVLKIPAHKICPIALIITILLSIFIWKMPTIDSFNSSLRRYCPRNMANNDSYYSGYLLIT